MNIPENLLCSPTDEYIRECGDGLYLVGITDEFLKKIGGEIIFIEVPETDDVYVKKELCATIESDSVAVEMYMPVEGKVVEINPAFDNGYDVVNNEPLTDGWIIKVYSENLTPNDTFDLLPYYDYKKECGNIN